MVDTPKKRRTDRSPDSATAPKRTRIHSTSRSTRSDTQPRQDRESSLSKDEDWVFRIKVLSATTSLNDELFKDAVRGFARICFPDGILKQLGQHVVEQHMREKQAKPANIQRTIEAFQPEMIRRLTGMLAGYFDTPGQVVSAVQVALGERHETQNNEETMDSSNIIVEQSRSPKKKRRSHSRKLQDATPSRDYDNNLDGVFVDVECPTTPAENTVSNFSTVSQRQKDKKISSTWDWNIDPDEVTEEAIQHAFPRTADLFAYHTLPTTQQMLGPTASRKEMRLDMRSLLNGMSQEEFQKWVESLDKLRKGNRGMLVRPELTLMNNGQLSRNAQVVTDLIFGPWPAVTVLNRRDMRERILKILKQRGISEVSVEPVKFKKVCHNHQTQTPKGRAYMERILRHLVFLHKDKFTELKATPVVKEWERKTGLEW